MAKKLKKDSNRGVSQDREAVVVPPITGEVKFSFGPDFISQKRIYQRSGTWPRFEKRLTSFIEKKQANPTEQTGDDRPFFTGGHYSGLWHAHISVDDSIVYKYDAEKNCLKIYGIFSHADLGTGNPPKMLKQITVGSRLRGQVFEIRPKSI